MNQNKQLRSISLTLVTLALASEAAIPDTQSDNVAPDLEMHAQHSVPAEPIKRVGAKYPMSALRKGKHGWVEIMFCVDEEGRPQNISVLDSAGGRDFERAAIKAAEGFEYSPATVQGQPSWQSRNKTTITFEIEGQRPKVSRKILAKLEQLRAFIDADEFHDADQLLGELLETEEISLGERVVLWNLQAHYEQKRGNPEGVRTAVGRLMASDGKWVTENTHAKFLSLRTVAEIQTGHYFDALESFDQLIEKSGEDAELVRPLRDPIAQVTRLIESDKIFVIDARMTTPLACDDCKASWRFTPVRSSFALSNIIGQLDSFDMRCDHRRYTSEVTDLVEWQIPESWGTCSVQFFGSTGTTFNVAMFPEVTE